MVGSAAASFCVEAVGMAKVSRLSAQDVAARLVSFRQLMHVPEDAV
jgi:hypothetical protein